MRLKDKAARIVFDDPAPAETPAPVAPQAPVARPRAKTGVELISQSINRHHEVSELKAKLKEYEDAKLIVMLDPKRVRQSKWKNRHELSYSTAEFAELKAEIVKAGGNVQAIKVRPVGPAADGEPEYEVVYGRRRLRACLELGLQVAAVVEELSELEAFQEMDRENRSREDLSPWEQGIMYRDALEQGLFPSLRQMALALQVDASGISKALRLASLPDEIVHAFPSPLDLQYRWGDSLLRELERDSIRILKAAREVAAMAPRPPAKEVLDHLLGRPVRQKATPGVREFKADGKKAVSWKRDAKGNGVARFSPGFLTPAKEKKLMEFLERLVQ